MPGTWSGCTIEMYAELHCHSCYSLLDGVSRPAALIARAAELEMPAMALTDHDGLYGVVDFWRAASGSGVKPIVGVELTLTGGRHLTLLAEDDTGYANLSQLITTARMRCEKGKAEATWDHLAAHSAGLIALSGCRQGEIASLLLAGKMEAAHESARCLHELFGPDRLFVELQRQLRPGDERLSRALISMADGLRLPLVATNNIHYASRDGHCLQDVLVAIRHRATLDTSHHLRRGNSEAYLKSVEQMSQLFADRPDALVSTLEIARRCQLTLQHGVQDLPRFPVPSGLDAGGYLRQLCQAAMSKIYGSEPAERVRWMLDHELAVIQRLGLVNYFLIVWDIMRFSREQGIRCQGRGSASNSLVAFLLHITPIDPLEHDLVFERFLSEERATLPDIDIDFQADRREEVIQYVYQRYGREHASMACTLVTFRQRSAVRDVGKALGFPRELIDTLASASDRRGLDEAWRDLALFADHVDSQSWQLMLQLCSEIHGLPRHLGIHNGGFVLSRRPLPEIMPLEPATMEDRTVCQWDKESLEEAGMVKIDLLGLRMLSVLEDACDIVEETGQRPDLDRLSFDDPSVYGMICSGDTIGCFQVESRAQAQLVPRFRPRSFEDLIVEISLIRPGPIQGNMVQPYLRRRWGEEPVTTLHSLLEPALSETLGVIVFQEQVLKIARNFAGFSGGQGELLRRALGHKNGVDRVERLRKVFLEGAEGKGVPIDVAEAVFEQLKAFGGYAFAKSHAASFAVIVYQSAWLKCYHPGAFYAALLNNQPMGFWSPAVLINDAKRRGISILPADINGSGVAYQLTDGAIRIGLASIKGVGEQGGERILLARRDGPFSSLADFCRRTRLPRLLVERLILAGAIDSCHTTTRRRGLLWQLGLLDYERDTLLLDEKPDPAPAELPPLRPLEALAEQLKVLGVSADEHLMAHHRARLREQGVFSSRDLHDCRDGQWVWIAGQVTVLQAPPTAKGFWFLTLEDEFGMIDVIIRPAVAIKYRRVWRNLPLLAVRGWVQRQRGAVNVLAQRPWRLAGASTNSQT
ncbi:MAG: error-prone DNA polymerase [Chloroflexota bacterium]|nr:error-prone DNA polymerase [Chloroflexota bacterium]